MSQHLQLCDLREVSSLLSPVCTIGFSQPSSQDGQSEGLHARWMGRVQGSPPLLCPPLAWRHWLELGSFFLPIMADYGRRLDQPCLQRK